MKYLFLLLALTFTQLNFAQDEVDLQATEIEVNQHVTGTLLLPNNIKKPDLAIIIAGSGPTDRDGNQNFLKSNNLKKIATEVSLNGIASFRYDKRIVKQIRKRKIDKNIMFDDFVTDAISVINYFKKTGSYNKIYIIGHSQGSLVGLLAAKNKADGFISLAGAGQTIDRIIIEQVTKTAPQFKVDTERVFDVLRKGKTTSNFPTALASLFNLDIQPFIANWITYNPVIEIAKLNIPCLIINGTKDLQVSETEAKILNDAARHSTLKIYKNMNHVLTTIKGDNLENSKSYNEPYRKLTDRLITDIVEFIKQ